MERMGSTFTPCEVGATPHTWRAINGGPFGWTETDADGFLQVCAECGVKRPPMLLEGHMVRTIKDLRSALAARSATDATGNCWECKRPLTDGASTSDCPCCGTTEAQDAN